MIGKEFKQVLGGEASRVEASTMIKADAKVKQQCEEIAKKLIP